MAIVLAPASASANCNAYPFSVSQPAVERFVMRPSRLLDEFREGGPQMTGFVSLIAASSRAVIPALITQARVATPQQRRAIAYGFANAAKLCAVQSPQTTKLIEEVVRKQTETSFQADFQAGTTNGGEQMGTVSAKRTPSQRSIESDGNALFDPANPGSIQSVKPMNTVPQIRRYDLPVR